MKLSLETLKQQTESVASEKELTSISGGLENSCHTTYQTDGTVTITKDGTIIIKP